MTFPDNDYVDFNDDFNNTEEAAPGATGPGYVPPSTYRVVCCEQDPKSDGKPVDHEAFKANSGTNGFKLFFEIVEPAEVKDPISGKMIKTKGEVIEHVFWITKKNLGFIKRDVRTILGRPLKSLPELKQIVWLGKTVEVGVKDDTYGGVKRSRVNFFNPWSPKEGVKATPPADQPKAPSAATAPAAGGSAPGEEADGDPDF